MNESAKSRIQDKWLKFRLESLAADERERCEKHREVPIYGVIDVVLSPRETTRYTSMQFDNVELRLDENGGSNNEVYRLPLFRAEICLDLGVVNSSFFNDMVRIRAKASQKVDTDQMARCGQLMICDTVAFDHGEFTRDIPIRECFEKIGMSSFDVADEYYQIADKDKLAYDIDDDEVIGDYIDILYYKLVEANFENRDIYNNGTLNSRSELTNVSCNISDLQ